MKKAIILGILLMAMVFGFAPSFSFAQVHTTTPVWLSAYEGGCIEYPIGGPCTPGSQTFEVPIPTTVEARAVPHAGYTVGWIIDSNGVHGGSDIVVRATQYAAYTGTAYFTKTAPILYNITIHPGFNGTTKCNGHSWHGSDSSWVITVQEHENLNCTFVPDTDYVIDSIVCPLEWCPASAPVTELIIRDITRSFDVFSSFALATFNIDYTLYAGGDMIIDGNLVNGPDLDHYTVNIHRNVDLVFRPHAGYVIKNVKVDGEDKGPITNRSFNNIVANHVITVVFSEILYRCDFSSDTGEGVCIVGGTGDMCDPSDRLSCAFHCENKRCVKGLGQISCEGLADNLSCYFGCNDDFQCVPSFYGPDCDPKNLADCLKKTTCASDGTCRSGGGGAYCTTALDQCAYLQKRCNTEGQCVPSKVGPLCSSSASCLRKPTCGKDKKCKTGGGGDYCATSDDCAAMSMRCNSNMQCVPSKIGPSCSSSQECNLKPKCTFGKKCESYGTGAYCASAEECEDLFLGCARDVSGLFICSPGGRGPSCYVSEGCSNKPKCTSERACQIGGAGAYCSSMEECIYLPMGCTGNQITGFSCVPGGLGKSCSRAYDCYLANQPPCPDIDRNGRVTAKDVAFANDRTGACDGDGTGKYDVRADMNRDGCIKIDDVLYIKSYLGKTIKCKVAFESNGKNNLLADVSGAIWEFLETIKGLFDNIDFK